ncbi:(2Fe-2S)-binding protein [Paenibacillus glycinis]|uniref:Ferric siderophore reductase C-terminal domain-containing protein n=1 Tax=Paenibacillus glycinis TaxID=2697035 RepID=A0ABW9XZ27_9BACL|nr:(2Fe-2S)-binding protein [Paenibacillus glycinis]NBD27476.1 hypothetical protein [Paenibacillus glycinis]
MTTAYDFSLVKTYLHISPEGASHVLDEMPAVDFFRAARLEEMMSKTGETVQAIGYKLPGSYFGTSLCHLCITKLIFLAMYGKLLDLRLEHLTFQIDYEEGHGHPHLGYKINEVIARNLPAENQDEFVTEDWRTFMAVAVTPAVQAIAKAARMNAEMIWQQFGGIAGMVKDFVGQMQLPAEVAERFDHHFRLLSEAIAPEAFGRKRNPFQWEPSYVDNPYRPNERWIMRSACCQYDRREGGTKCFTCPRMTPDERACEVQRIKEASAVS